MKKGLKDSNQKKLSKSLREKLQTSKGRIFFVLSTVMLIVVLNMIISKTTGFNAIEKSYDYIDKAVNGQKNNKIEYTKEIKNIEIESENYGEPGSWHIDKSAEWTGFGKAKVTFNVDTLMKKKDRNKDVIIVMDISGSMSGSKLDKAKVDAIELVNALLDNPINQVAFITFDTKSTVVSEFTNNKQNMISVIESLTAKGNTNYNQALENVDKVMENYKKDPNKNVVTLFLTDGYPNEETPNQIGTYKLLKDKYPYMDINGIQYEMGKDVIGEIKQISDNQWVANQDTLDNVLFEASIPQIIYEKFEVIDYIDNDYFEVVSEDDITVSIGTVKLTLENGKQKVVWTIDSFRTGMSATMDINLILKDEYKNEGGYYPTNEKEVITSKLPDEEEKAIERDLTPVLKNDYKVIYEANNPNGCSLQDFSETHFVYENVTINQDELTCKGHIFKGWEIIDDVQKVNNDVFVMPEHNVTIRATWTKPSIDKSMKGKVWRKINLYETIEAEANESDVQAKLYEGDVDDTFEEGADKNVYYYTGDNVKNNNVIFGEHCWKIVRTTTTGGVKLLYNGKPDSNGACTATGEDATIGKSVFNTKYSSPAYVGYMYNIAYEYKNSKASGLFGGDVTYENGEYKLQNTLGYFASNRQYSCNNSTGTCSRVRYYFYAYGSNYLYIELDGKAKNIEEALDQMLHADDVNTKDSTIKAYIDKWYEENLKEKYAEKLEDTIFCNDRNISSLGGWEPTGKVINGETAYLKFNEYTSSKNLECKNDTDKFSTQNTKAKLKYPIGLLSAPEANIMGTSASTIGKNYWLGSPTYFDTGNARERIVYATGSLGWTRVDESYNFVGVRPSVSLKPGTVYSDGDGTVEDPFVID